MALLASVADSLKLWTFTGDNLNLHISCEHPQEVLNTVAWNHTNQVVALGGVGRKVYFVQVNNGQLLSSVPNFPNNNLIEGDINSVAFSTNSRNLAGGSERSINIWDLKTMQSCAVFHDLKGTVTKLKFLNEGILASGDAGGALKFWNINDGTSSKELFADERTSPVRCLDSSLAMPVKLACGYDDGFLCVWDVESSTLVRRQPLHTGQMSCLAFSPKNLNLVATGGHDGRFNLVDISSKSSSKLSASIDTCERITSISFHEDAVHAAVGTTTGSILLYDWRNLRKPISTMAAHRNVAVNSLCFQSSSAKPSSRSSSRPVSPPSSSRQERPSDVHSTTSASSSSASISPSVVSGSSGREPKGRAGLTEDSLERSVGSDRRHSDAQTAHISVSSSSTHAAADPRRQSLPRGGDVGGVAVAGGAGGRSRSLSTPQAVNSITPIPAPAPAVAIVVADKVAPPAKVSSSTPTGQSMASKRPKSSTDPAHVLPPPPPPPQQQQPTHASTAGKTSNRESSRLQSPRTTAADGNSSSEGLFGGTEDEFDELRRAVKPVSCQDLEDAIAALRYDIHKEVQMVVREQIRQFAVAKEDTAELISSLAQQLKDVLSANAELRAENERLRRIY